MRRTGLTSIRYRTEKITPLERLIEYVRTPLAVPWWKNIGGSQALAFCAKSSDPCVTGTFGSFGQLEGQR